MKSMRLLIAVGFLLCSLSAFAQPFVGDAVLSDVLAWRDATIQAAAPAVALAADRQGVVIAWTMLSVGGAQSVYVARLDSGGRIVAPVTEIGPAATKSVDAYWPSIAVSPEHANIPRRPRRCRRVHRSRKPHHQLFGRRHDSRRERALDSEDFLRHFSRGLRAQPWPQRGRAQDRHPLFEAQRTPPRRPLSLWHAWCSSMQSEGTK